MLVPVQVGGANYYRVVPGGPYEGVLTWQREIFACWDLEADVPVYVANKGGAEVRACRYEAPDFRTGRE